MKHNHHPTDILSRVRLNIFCLLFRIEESVLTSVLLTCDLLKYYVDQNGEVFTSVLIDKRRNLFAEFSIETEIESIKVSEKL